MTGLAFVSVTATAQSANFDGVHLGLGVAVIQPTVRYTDADGSLLKWEKTTAMPEIDLSYHKALNNKFLLGIGINANFGKRLDLGTESEDYGRVSAWMSRHYSIYIQPTYVLNNSTAAFAKLAYHSARVNAVGQPGADWIPDRFRAHGIGYSLGAVKNIDKNFYIQGELQYVKYSDRNFVNEYDFHWKFNQRTVGAIFSVGYKFQ